MFKSDFPDNREMSKEKDAEILLAALESKGISASEDFGSGSYNGKKGYYIREGRIDSWKDEEIEDVKSAADSIKPALNKLKKSIFEMKDKLNQALKNKERSDKVKAERDAQLGK